MKVGQKQLVMVLNFLSFKVQMTVVCTAEDSEEQKGEGGGGGQSEGESGRGEECSKEVIGNGISLKLAKSKGQRSAGQKCEG